MADSLTSFTLKTNNQSIFKLFLNMFEFCVAKACICILYCVKTLFFVIDNLTIYHC